MKKHSSIPFKALLLLIIFSLHMLTGFACSLGWKMGFNNLHHHADATGIQAAGHHHAAAVQHPPAQKDDCCNNEVVQLVRADKSLPQQTGFQLAAPVTFIPPAAFYAAVSPIDPSTGIAPGTNRSDHPSLPDILIAIQRFQI